MILICCACHLFAEFPLPTIPLEIPLNCDSREDPNENDANIQSTTQTPGEEVEDTGGYPRKSFNICATISFHFMLNCCEAGLSESEVSHFDTSKIIETKYNGDRERTKKESFGFRCERITPEGDQAGVLNPHTKCECFKIMKYQSKSLENNLLGLS